MKYTTAYRCFVGFWLAGLVVIFLRIILSNRIEMGPAIYFIGLGLIVVGFIIGLIFFRCPYCRKHMPLRSGPPKRCPRCNRQL